LFLKQKPTSKRRRWAPRWENGVILSIPGKELVSGWTKYMSQSTWKGKFVKTGGKKVMWKGKGQKRKESGPFYTLLVYQATHIKMAVSLFCTLQPKSKRITTQELARRWGDKEISICSWGITDSYNCWVKQFGRKPIKLSWTLCQETQAESPLGELPPMASSSPYWVGWDYKVFLLLTGDIGHS
jgi:hypothetical protein